MNIDPNISQIWTSPEIQELIESGEIDEAGIELLESEILQQNTLERSERRDENAFFPFQTPSLSTPNYNLLSSEQSSGNLSAEDLSDSAIKSYFDDFPEFTAFLEGQDLIGEAEIYDRVRQKLLENPGSPYSAETLAATALAESMDDVWRATADPAVKDKLDGTRAEILMNNNPSARVLIEAREQAFIEQGLSPKEARQQAIAETLGDLDVELSENGITTPFYGTHPEMNGAIAKLLVEELGGVSEAQAFVNNLTSLVGLEAGLVGIFEKMAEVQSTDKAQPINTNTQQNMIKGAQELVDASLAQINKLPLPGDQKGALLGFMEAISTALAEMKAVLAEISMADLQRSRKDTNVQLDTIKTRLKGQLQKLRKAAKAKKKGGIFGKLKKAFRILGPILAVIAVVVIVVAIIVLLPAAVILAPLVLILIPILMMTLVMIIVAMAVAESGKMDDMMETIMTAATWLMQDLMDLDISDEVVAAILAAVLIAFVMFFPLGFIATPALFLFIPELMVRSGVLGAVAQGLGGELGMSDKEIMKFEAGLRGIAGLATLAAGLRGSSSFESVSKDEQDLLDERVRNRHGVRMGKRDEARLGAYARTGETQTLNQLARTDADALEEQQEEMQKMIAMLTKIIAQLQKLLVALLSGGDSGAVDAAINDIQSIIDGGLPSLVNLKSDQELALQPRIKAFAEALSASVPFFLPSENSIEEQQSQLMQNTEEFEEKAQRKMSQIKEIFS